MFINCGTGEKTRFRTIINKSKNGGEPCPNLIETTSCSDNSCPKNCLLSKWSEWTPCQTNGLQARHRTIITPPDISGNKCENLFETREC